MSATRTLRWVLAAPALLLGAFVYWTLAFGLGVVSLTSLHQLDVDGVACGGLLSEPLDADEPPSVEALVPLDATVAGDPAAEGETIPVEVVGSHEYQPGATAF